MYVHKKYKIYPSKCEPLPQYGGSMECFVASSHTFCPSMLSNFTKVMYYFCDIKLKMINKTLIQTKLDIFLCSVVYLYSECFRFPKVCLCASFNSYTNPMYFHSIKTEKEATEGQAVVLKVIQIESLAETNFKPRSSDCKFSALSKT